MFMGIKAILKEFKKRQDTEAQKNLVYSQNEADTGKIWIDGKKIYRKVFILPAIAKGTMYEVDISELKSFAYIQLYGFIQDFQNQYMPLLNSDTDNATLNIFLRIKNDKLIVVMGKEKQILNGHVVLEYTKTTN
ncbi:hypothetical protein [uncultured Treponema sp.]|uniref:hypothetical protein n=1 Tax=uncultured Treponema sp. TaxID=162155 RepID=UPI0025997EA3|nr:hypothetical protein [uncultured Treponema sp.]